MSPPASCYPLIVTVHAVYALACFGEDKFIDPISANFTLETVGVVRVIAGHNGFVKDGKLANIATIGTIGTNGGAVGQQKQVCICRDFVTAFSALETVDVEEGLAMK